jgi:hypothetical protein
MSYTTAEGRVVQVPARRVAVAIDQPTLATPAVSDAQAIKDFLRDRTLARDGWRMYVRPHVSARFAFERAKEAVQRDGLVKVLEVETLHPSHFEAWYFGQVKGTDRCLFVEASVHARSRVLELRAATPEERELIGAVAEYRRRLRELLSERFMRHTGRVVLVDAAAQRMEDAPPQLHAALLLRHLEGEITAQELEDELRRGLMREGDDALGLLEGYARGQETANGEGAAAEAAPTGHSADFELIPGLLETWRPIVVRFASDESLDAPGPVVRRRQQYDRHSDMEIMEFEVDDGD